MDIKAKGMSLWSLLIKYKYVFLIIVIGLLLMLIPTKNKDTPTESNTPIVTEANRSMEKRLEELLSMVHGAGEIRVLLTIQSDEEVVYQTDTQGNSDNIHTNTVIITDSSRNQAGLVQKKYPPTYSGAIIVCVGGDRSDVRLALTNAVMNATGLRADQISVLKMK